jgi:hypothetical protein
VRDLQLPQRLGVGCKRALIVNPLQVCVDVQISISPFLSDKL